MGQERIGRCVPMFELILLTLLPYIAVALYIYHIYRKNRRQREADGPKPYEPSVVDRSFIEAATAGRQRLDTATRELSGILQRWGATEAPEAAEDDYDPISVALLPDVRAGLPAEELERRLDSLMWQAFRVHPANTLGIANYITNWWTARPASAA
jgi:hypothetical protein